MKIGNWMAVAAVACLAACGGGGGGSDAVAVAAQAPAPVDITGTAAKGLLSHAKVSLFAIGEQGPASAPLATTQTDDAGHFSLSIAPPSGPLLVQVETVAGSRMLDETQVANGEFKQVDAPPSLVLRSIVQPASDGALSVQVNPFTEAAVQAAATATGSDASSRAWSPEAVAAGMALAQKLVPEGVNPFRTPATGLAQVPGNDLASNALLMALSGFMQHAADCVNDGSGVSGADVVCEVARLDALATVVLDTNQVQHPKAADLSSYRREQYQAAVTAAQATGSPLLTLAQTAAAAPVSIDPTTGPALVATAKASLIDFVAGLRNGLQATRSTFANVDRLVDPRSAQLTLDAARKLGDAIAQMSECRFKDGQFSCGAPWELAPHGGYRRSLSDSQYATASGHYDPATGYQVDYLLEYVDPQRVSRQASFTFVSSQSDDQGHVMNTVSGGSAAGTVYSLDDADQFVELRDVTLAVSSAHGLTLPSADLQGSMTQWTSGLPVLTGHVELGLDAHVGPQGAINVLTRLNAHLSSGSASEGSSPTRDVDFTASLTPRSLTGAGFDAYDIQLGLDLNGQSHLTLHASQLSAQRADARATLSAGGNAIAISLVGNAPTGRYCLSTLNGRLCSDRLTLSSASGAYTAQLVGDATSGDILWWGQKVGTFDAKGVQVDGQEYSLY